MRLTTIYCTLHSIYNFFYNWFVNCYRFHSKFDVFTLIVPSVTHKNIISKICFKKSKTIFLISYRLKLFYFNCKQFRVFKIAKFEFNSKVTVHNKTYGNTSRGYDPSYKKIAGKLCTKLHCTSTV